jgi:hypothetical protein
VEAKDPFAANLATRKIAGDVAKQCLDMRMLIALQEDVPLAHLMHGATVLQDLARTHILAKSRRGGKFGPSMFALWLLHARHFIRCRLTLKAKLLAAVHRRRKYIHEVVEAWKACDARAQSQEPGKITFLEFAVSFVPDSQKRAVVIDFHRLAMHQLFADMKIFKMEMRQYHENFYYCVTEAFKQIATGAFQVLRLLLLDVLLPSKFRPTLRRSSLRVSDLLRTYSGRVTGDSTKAGLAAFISDKIIKWDNQDLPQVVHNVLHGKYCQMRLFPLEAEKKRQFFPWFRDSAAKVLVLARRAKQKADDDEKDIKEAGGTSIPIGILDTDKVVQSPKQRLVSELLNLTKDEWYKHRLFEGTMHVREVRPQHSPASSAARNQVTGRRLLASPTRNPRSTNSIPEGETKARRAASARNKKKPAVPRFRRRDDTTVDTTRTNNNLSFSSSSGPLVYDGDGDCDGSLHADLPPPPLLPISTMIPSLVVLTPKGSEESFVAPVRLVVRPQLPAVSHGRFFGTVAEPYPAIRRALSGLSEPMD